MGQPTTRVLTARRSTTARLLSHHRRATAFPLPGPATDRGDRGSPGPLTQATPDRARAELRVDPLG